MRNLRLSRGLRQKCVKSLCTPGCKLMVPKREARLWRCRPQIDRSKKLLGRLYVCRAQKKFVAEIFFPWPVGATKVSVWTSWNSKIHPKHDFAHSTIGKQYNSLGSLEVYESQRISTTLVLSDRLVGSRDKTRPVRHTRVQINGCDSELDE